MYILLKIKTNFS